MMRSSYAQFKYKTSPASANRQANEVISVSDSSILTEVVATSVICL